MDKRYRVIFSSLLKEEDHFKHQMLRLGVSEEVTKDIVKKAPVILKRRLSLREARIYADAIFQAGGKATIHVEDNGNDRVEDGSSSGIITMKNFIMCPRCGQKQVRSEACVRCGFIF